MKKLLLGIAMSALLTTAGRAQYNPCVASSTTNCSPVPRITLAPVSPNPVVVSPGGTVSASTTATTTAGHVVVTSVAESCAVMTNTIATNYPTIVSNWTAVYWNQQWITNAGLSASFTAANPGSGTIEFYTKYTAPSPCAGTYTTNLSVSVLATNCAPWITSGPTNQTMAAGATTTFNVVAHGTPPLAYQWILNGTIISGATESCCTIANVQPTDAGSYAVTVANAFGNVTSSSAVLTVALCDTVPFGLVSWWRAENNTLDSTGGNDGTLVGNVTYGPGRVGQAFSLDGAGSYVSIPSASSVNFSNNMPMTVETWVYRTGSASVMHIVGKRSGCSYGGMQYQIAFDPSNGLGFFTDGILVSTHHQLPMFTWQHLAVTFGVATAIFYIDGQAVASDSGTLGAANTAPLKIGAAGGCATFSGLIDEVSIYNRSLSASEIQAIYEAGVAGKCWSDPHITVQPASQNAAVGGAVTFTVVAVGSAPLKYQWFCNGGAIAGATSASFTLNNVSLLQAGTYAVVVSNIGGSATSAAATLTVSQVAAPVFSPVGGSYPSAQNVVVTCSTPDTVIHYTTNGQEPTQNNPPVASGASVAVGNSLTLKAKAWKAGWPAGWSASATETESYLIEDTPSDQPPTVSVSPPTGTSLLASDDLPILVEASDPDGAITRVQLFRDGVQVAETTESPLQYTMSQVYAGTYTFIAKAMDDAGFVTVSPPTVITVSASGPVVSLAGQRPYFTSSPGILEARVLGVNPSALARLTLNGTVQTDRTGSFTLSPPLAQGANTFTLVATDVQFQTGQATTTVYLDSVAPTISISAPANNSTLSTTRINVSGSYIEASLKRITVNGVPAFITGTSWEALNVLLAVGANTITVTAEDLAGNTGTASITVNVTANPVDPVQLQASLVGGLAPLQVTFTAQATVPGTLQQVLYDFTGANTTFQTANDLQPVTHTYANAGQYFPVVTLVTTAGRFSSPGGWNSGDPIRLRINVQAPPQQVGDPIAVTDPVDLKATADGKLYVLSRSTATILEYNTAATPPTQIRSLTGIGTTPTGLDVDSEGNVYVAISGDNQVAKFNPTTTSFLLDPSFGTAGAIGKADKSSGTGDGEFNTPYDVAVSPSGGEIVISDSGNNRIERFSSGGTFVDSFGQSGTGSADFSAPKGLTYDTSGYLYIVDSSNSRISLALPPMVVGTSGGSGTALGQFQGPVNLAVSQRGICVADGGNNRVQQFEPVPGGDDKPQTPFSPRGSLSSGLSLSQPNSAAVVPDLLEEKLYIADTGNNRVILVKLPSGDPLTVWNTMVARITAGDISGAVTNFCSLSTDGYRQAFLTIGATDLLSDLPHIGTLTPVFVRNEEAQYYFEGTIDGHLLLFPVKFVRENGAWKIMEF